MLPTIFEDLIKPVPMNGLTSIDAFDGFGPFVDKGDYYELNVDVPGVKKEDINLDIINGYVRLNAERETNNNTRIYKKAFKLPHWSTEDISASLVDGVLTLSVPKNESTKKIEIEGAT